MRKNAVAVMATTAALIAGAIGFAGPAPADGTSAGADSAWEMPDLKGLILQTAIAEVHDASGNSTLPVEPVDYAHGQKVLNYTNWKVCDQSPKPGREVTQKTKKVTVFVNRLNATRCYG